mgnify:CR=1 FL=1
MLFRSVVSGIITAASGERALFALFVLMRIAFLLAMLWFAYTLWRNHRVEIGTWPLRAKAVFYGAAALVVAQATDRLELVPEQAIRERRLADARGAEQDGGDARREQSAQLVDYANSFARLLLPLHHGDPFGPGSTRVAIEAAVGVFALRVAVTLAKGYS